MATKSERVNTAWSPISPEIQRRGERARISRRQGIIAAVSTTVVLGSLFTVLVTSPGWEIVKKTFFDIDYGREVFPTVIAGLWINLQLTFIGGPMANTAKIVAKLRPINAAKPCKHNWAVPLLGLLPST